MRLASAVIITLALIFLSLPQSALGQSGRNRKINPEANNSSDDNSTKAATTTGTSSAGKASSTDTAKNTAKDIDTSKNDDAKNAPVVKGDPGDTLSLDSTLVSIPLMVSDRSGRYLPSLSKNDFALYEDGIKQQIAFFSSDEVPFHVVLVIDTSGSTTESGRDIKNAAESFVGELHERDQVEVMSFASSVNVEARFTSDREELTRAIERIRWGGSTKLYEAVYQAVKTELRGIEGRKAIVLLTDGDDTSSRRIGYRQAIDAAVESGALIFVARYPSDDNSYGPWGRGPGGHRGGGWPGNPWPQGPNPNSNRPPWPWPFLNIGIQPLFGFPQAPPTPRGGTMPGSGGGQNGGPVYRGTRGDFLTDLIYETGGDMFNANKYSDMSSLLQTVADQLRHVYVIGYYPSNAKLDGRFRKINIQVVDNPSVVVKYKRGYNAPTEQSTAASTTSNGKSNWAQR